MNEHTPTEWEQLYAQYCLWYKAQTFPVNMGTGYGLHPRFFRGERSEQLWNDMQRAVHNA